MKQVVCLQQKLKNAGWGKTDRRDRATSHVIAGIGKAKPYH